MTQLAVILAVATVFARDLVARPIMYSMLGPAGAAWATLGGTAMVALLLWAGVGWSARRMERTGSLAMVTLTDQMIATSRWGILVWHVLAVLVFGWLDAVRAVVGNTFGADELIAIGPVLAVFVVGWWAAFPVDRMLREAVILRNLDHGLAVRAGPTRRQFVVMNIRHDLLIVLLPLAVLIVWSEAVERLFGGLILRAGAPTLRVDSIYDRVAAWLHNTGTAEPIHTAVRVLGSLAVFALLPLALRLVWDAEPLDVGSLRDRLLALCKRHGVRIRELLVWRTHGSVANGAVIGLFGRLRYVLLSEVLLERLSEREVEAVMAHEVGHVRRRHMIWLIVALLACTGGASAGLELVGRGMVTAGGVPEELIERWVGGVTAVVASLVGLPLGLLAFGWISRRFEWQADAFAAQHLSGLVTARKSPGNAEGLLITSEAAGAMKGALRTVAIVNHMDPWRFSFRHGSIARRMKNLEALVGIPAESLRIDASVRRIKIVCGIVATLLLVWAFWP